MDITDIKLPVDMSIDGPVCADTGKANDQLRLIEMHVEGDPDGKINWWSADLGTANLVGDDYELIDSTVTHSLFMNDVQLYIDEQAEQGNLLPFYAFEIMNAMIVDMIRSNKDG
jgi:hypothetical protein